MVKSELASKLTKKLPEFTETDVVSALDCILRQMSEALVQGERIEARGFGSFDLYHRAPRIARNHKTGESVNISAKVAVHSKPGKEMKVRTDIPQKEIA